MEKIAKLNIQLKNVLTNLNVRHKVIHNNVLVFYKNGTIYNISLDGHHLKDIIIDLECIQRILGHNNTIYIQSKSIYYYNLNELELKKVDIKVSDIAIFGKVYVLCYSSIYQFENLKDPIYVHTEMIVDFLIAKNDVYVISNNKVYLNHTEIDYLAGLGFYEIFYFNAICLINANFILVYSKNLMLKHLPNTGMSITINSRYCIAYNHTSLSIFDTNMNLLESLTVNIDSLDVFDDTFYISDQGSFYKFDCSAEYEYL